jgi:phosphoserine phosphatase
MTHVLTLIAARGIATLGADIIARVRQTIGGGAADVLSPGEAVDITCLEPPDLQQVRAALGGKAIDAVATKTEGRRKRLLVADMDSTIVTAETLDELAAHAGVKEQVAAITRRSMNGEIDFVDALRQRVAMLQGLTHDALEATWRSVQIMPGARELVATMRAHGATTVLVSGGFTYFTSRVADLLGFDIHHANTLLDDGSVLTGKVAEPVLDRGSKRDTLVTLAAAKRLDLSETMAVGDGANDLDMLREAGLGVAFHAKPIVAQAIPARVDHADLRALLFIQGYRTSEFSAA